MFKLKYTHRRLDTDRRFPNFVQHEIANSLSYVVPTGASAASLQRTPYHSPKSSAMLVETIDEAIHSQETETYIEFDVRVSIDLAVVDICVEISFPSLLP